MTASSLNRRALLAGVPAAAAILALPAAAIAAALPVGKSAAPASIEALVRRAAEINALQRKAYCYSCAFEQELTPEELNVTAKEFPQVCMELADKYVGCSDALGDELDDINDTIEATPANSASDLLLKLQAAVYGLYHMTDPAVFYNREDLWTVATEVGMSADRKSVV